MVPIVYFLELFGAKAAYVAVIVVEYFFQHLSSLFLKP